MVRLSLHEARRIALAAQGFGRPRPRGAVSLRHVEAVLNRLHLVQIDSVNVLVRSHYMPFFSRLGAYDRALLDDEAYRKGRVFEYWAHEACIVPIDQYPLMRSRMADWRGWKREALIEREEPGYLDAVLEEVRQRGPLTAGGLEDGGKRTGPWWGYGKGKVALEVHFGRGRLTTRARRNFSRVYDLPERVLPAAALSAPPPGVEDAHREMLRRASEALGVATTADLADYYRLKMPAARPLIRDLVDAGDLRPVEVEGWNQPAFLHRDAVVPPRVNARALLTPFDSLVWNRDRTERLFGFRYRIEIYVPEGQRQYGYYVLPFLLGDRLVARIDLKAHRQAGTLEVRGAFLEPGESPGVVAEALAAHLAEMADWLGLERVSVVLNGDLAGPLAAAVG